jgi:predicted membrane-bound mannosyltransferase
MATDTFTLHDINATLGALEVGVLICMFLLGASTVQAYVYYSKFPRDDWKIKNLVSLVYCSVLQFLNRLI